ncbi:hypothetical protein DFH08DRAFT_807056 [Mycena albidolilacea]|uniref:Uncharacterized protein n=1 Tax=Mycena albidolilacea TaxID=1033008 RepID=A0AAD7ESJ4_9AGAR|nr:hypothetical protein DFH08DRAFT_807056 [Mycena albidolilacea]
MKLEYFENPYDGSQQLKQSKYSVYTVEPGFRMLYGPYLALYHIRPNGMSFLFWKESGVGRPTLATWWFKLKPPYSTDLNGNACFQDPSTRQRPFSTGAAVKNAAKEPTEWDGMPVAGPHRTGVTGTACSPNLEMIASAINYQLEECMRERLQSGKLGMCWN